jgi:DNA polymerase-3 subunit beta
MKFAIIRAKLLDALQTVQNVVSSKSTLQILANAMIKVEGNQLHLTTTDLDITVKCSVEAEGEEAGGTTMPIRRLAGIVRELPEGKITVDVSDEDVAEVRCGASFFKIIGLPMRDFPPVPVPDGKFCYIMDQGVFREMLRKTSYAASQDETRHVLNGVLLAFKEAKLTMVATDGRRLALVEQEVEFPVEAEQELILPTKSVNELLHILKDEGNLKIYAHKNQVVFEFGNIMMSSKLVDGVYPNYRQVIPPGCDERVVLEREMLLTALRRVSLVTTDKSNSTRLTFSSNQLTILTNTPDIGEARETMPIKYAGKEITVTFNPEYIMDPLRSIDSDEITFEMNDGHSPALIKCGGMPFLYVLMPLRIG